MIPSLGDIRCRACASHSIVPIVHFGRTPIADRLITREQLNDPEIFESLTLVFCENCALVQISETVSPEILFSSSYPYFSSFSNSLCRHFATSAAAIIANRKLGPDSLVIEAASNDGCMLRNFVEAGIPVLGIDPADAPVARARQVGVRTIHGFFSRQTAEKLVKENHRADVLLANNVLAHVADLNGFVDGIAMILKPSGQAVIECPYLADLITHCEFDTIYHQHLCYFSVTSLDALFRSHGMVLVDVERTSIHGGSLRVFIEHSGTHSERLKELLAEERRVGLDSYAYFHDFARRIERVRDELTALLGELKQRGKRIAGYGAAAKATTLLAFCGIGAETLDYVVDLSTFKQGRYMPGNHLAIHAPDHLLDDHPDYLLILAWNFASEIVRQQERYQRAGGRFVVPIPRPSILSGIQSLDEAALAASQNVRKTLPALIEDTRLTSLSTGT
jgi:SAM-dependent methyltransferase